MSSPCPICGSIAYMAESIEYNNTLYHTRCMACCVCHCRLTKKRINSVGNKFYCPAHNPEKQKEMTKSLNESVEGGIPFTKVIFDKYDADKTGTIDATEFLYMCREMGRYMTAQEAEVAIRVIDKEGVGKVTYESFNEWWNSNERFQKVTFNGQMLAYLNAAITSFMAYDLDGNGTICRNEFANLHRSLVNSAYKTTTEQADWDAMDANHSGCISFAEYRDWLFANAPRY